MHPTDIMHASYYGAYIEYSKPQYIHAVYKNLKVTALLETGMYYIPVYGMYASYIYTDIMHASYYGACTGDYACSIFSF